MRKATFVLSLVTAAGVSLVAGSLPVQESTRPAANTIRRDVNLVPVDFTVRDQDRRLVTDLPKERIRVFEDGREQPIEFFAYRDDVPLNLGVLLDTSTRLASLLELEADAARQFLRRVMRANDLAFVVSYDSRVKTLQVPTAELALLEEKVDTIQQNAGAPGILPTSPMPWPLPYPAPPTFPTSGGSVFRVARLYDALRVSAGRYLAREVGRKAVVIVALADDAQSESSLEDALDALLRSDIIAYVLQLHDGPGDHCDVLHIFGGGRLRRLAEQTGGRVLDVRGMRNLKAALAEIAEELHSQYSLGYRPLDEDWDGKYRKIRIRVEGRKYKVQSRKGYYALKRTLR